MSAGRRVLERIGAIVMPMLAAGLVLVAVRGLASTLAGGGPLPNGGNLPSDCYVYADVAGTLAPSTAKFLRCTDGDPTCDQDRACNGTCLFRARVCMGLTSKTRCTNPPCPQSPTVCDTPPCPPVCQPPPSLDTLVLNQRCPLEPPTSLVGSACGAFVEFPVALRGAAKGKPGRTRCRARGVAPAGTRPRSDTDVFFFVCEPPEGGCPASPSGAFL
jgi:hypothetical protein